jgi:molybdopterin synthase sulfur carrier subunit
MKVTVDYLGYIKNVLGVRQPEKIELEAKASVNDLLVLLAAKHGEPFRKAIYQPGGTDLKSTHILTVNGLLLNQLKGLDTKLSDGDTVLLMPVVSGG